MTRVAGLVEDIVRPLLRLYDLNIMDVPYNLLFMILSLNRPGEKRAYKENKKNYLDRQEKCREPLFKAQ